MKYIKQAAGLILSVILCASIVSCNENPETEELLPIADRNAILSQAGTFGLVTPQNIGNAIYYPSADGGITVMTHQNGAWKSDRVLDDAFVLHMAALGDELICGIAEGDGLAWSVYDIGAETLTPLPIPETSAAAEALDDASGICILEGGLYVMHSYWQGISRIDLTTWDCVTFDAETWGNHVLCSADETSFYIPMPNQIEVFDRADGDGSVYNWSEHENWPEGAKITGAYLTENDRMYLHISREDAMVPEEIKRAVWYVDTKGDWSQPTVLTNLGDLAAYSVTRLCGEYGGTLVLTDGDKLYAYDTESDKLAELCAFPQNGVICAGGYVLTQTDNGMEVVVEIPATVS